jgi:hypothetical protein
LQKSRSLCISVQNPLDRVPQINNDKARKCNSPLSRQSKAELSRPAYVEIEHKPAEIAQVESFGVVLVPIEGIIVIYL